MAYARTQAGAKWRVKRKRAIRSAGGSVKPDATNKQIAAKYRRHVLNKR